MSSKRVAYIAGPMRGRYYFNVSEFVKAEELLSEQGFDVINPHQEDAKAGFLVSRLPMDTDWSTYPPGFDKEACYKRCIDAVTNCDLIYMLKGWQESTGAKAELALAQWMGKQVVYEDNADYADQELPNWRPLTKCGCCGRVEPEGHDCFPEQDLRDLEPGKIPCERCGEPVFPEDKMHYCFTKNIAFNMRAPGVTPGLDSWQDPNPENKGVKGGKPSNPENPKSNAEIRDILLESLTKTHETVVRNQLKHAGEPSLWQQVLDKCDPTNAGVPGGKPSNAENPKDAIGSMKIPLSLWPTTATMMGSIGFLNGMLKYGRANFRAVGVRSSIYYDACCRHLDAWFEGEDIDPDDNVPHLAAALCCLAIIVDAQAAGKLNDDRNFPGGYRKLRDELSPLVAQLKEKHADKNPRHYTIGDSDGNQTI